MFDTMELRLTYREDPETPDHRYTPRVSSAGAAVPALPITTGLQLPGRRIAEVRGAYFGTSLTEIVAYGTAVITESHA